MELAFHFQRKGDLSAARDVSSEETFENGHKTLGYHVTPSTIFANTTRNFGLVFGQSGSGKTTLLQILAGLSKPTSGSIYIQRYTNVGKPNQSPKPLVPERVGIVFQFPERYFVADNVLGEVTYGWPRQRGGVQLKENLALNLQRAFNWAHVPELLILDEPLAGLDWKACADVVKLLKHLKKELTILVVSHDLKELEGLVDRSWRMEMGGVLREERLVV